MKKATIFLMVLLVISAVLLTTGCQTTSGKSRVSQTVNTNVPVCDIAQYCGDSICSPECGETFAKCAADCDEPCSSTQCGDNKCETACGEAQLTCPTDCR